MKEFRHTCVGLSRRDTEVFGEVIDSSSEISKEEFLKEVYVDKSMLCLINDRYVSFYKSVLNNEPIFFFDHSRIDYFFY